MPSIVNVASLLRKGRNLLYRGYLRRSIRRIGLNDILSDPYWKIVHKLSGHTQTHTIEGYSVDFEISTHTEFMRFRDLAGEQSIIADLLRALEPDDIVYDIGANVGTYTCFIASKLGPGHTVAFEPEPQNATKLHDNLKLNNLNAKFVEVALSDTNGTVDFALLGDEAGEGEHAIATNRNEKVIEVKSARGDTIIKQEGLPMPSVLKIDVEGAELSVLRGLNETLRDHVRLVYVEVHPEKLPDFGDCEPEIRAFLEGAGFEVTTLSSHRNEQFLCASK